MLLPSFFSHDARKVARNLLGKVLRVKHGKLWLEAMIIETEAYYIHDKASHASLGYTKKRKALFMPPGTIYMYYSRGGDSLNISCLGEGNAVLIKAAIPYHATPKQVALMRKLHAAQNWRETPHKLRVRPQEKLCSGQTLLCWSLGLKVPDWDGKQFDRRCFYIADVGYQPQEIIQTTRLGIPKGRDEHLQYRFIDYKYAKYCSSNPLTKRNWQEDRHYLIYKIK